MILKASARSFCCFLSFGVVFLFGCKRPVLDNDEVLTIDLREVRQSTSLRLDSLASDVELVRLETTEESLIQYFSGHVTDEYLVSVNNDRISLFDKQGKYLREVATGGKGPGDYGFVQDSELGPQDRLLYIYDIKDPYIKKYSLDSGVYAGQIPFADVGENKPLRSAISFEVLENGNIIVARHPLGRTSFLIFEQDQKGRFLKGIKEEIVGPGDDLTLSIKYSSLLNNKGEILYRGTDSLTVQSLKDTVLETRIQFILSESQQKGGTQFIYEPTVLFIGDKFVLFDLAITVVEKDKGGTYIGDPSVETFIFHLDQKRSQSLESLFVEELGVNLPIDRINVDAKGRFYSSIHPIDFKAHMGESLNSNIPTAKTQRIKELLDSLGDEDNPIVITGRFN